MKAELIVDAPIVGKKDIWIKKICKPHFDHPFHFHQLCELVWIEKGYGKFIIGDHIGNFSDGELILAGPELPHLWKCDQAFYQGNKNFYTKALGIYFPFSFILQLSDDVDVNKANAELIKKAQRGIRIRGNARKIIVQKMKLLDESSGYERLSHFLSIVHHLGQAKDYEYLAGVGYKNTKSDFDLSRFDEVYQFLLNNFHRDITLSEVAAICNMTPNAFSRYFKAKTEKTFSRFLNEIRIGHACRLLQSGAKKIDRIGYDCGYNNPTNFFKFFKLLTKRTPKEYQKRFVQMEGID